MRNIFRKKQYLDCPHLKHSLHFFYDEIRSCCANAKGLLFQKIDESIDLSENIDNIFYKDRLKVVKKINSIFTSSEYPKFCLGCSEFSKFLSESKIPDFENTINSLYIQNFMGCNAKCIYCTFEYCRNKNQLYEAFPIIDSLINNNVLSDYANIYMSGGEPTISPEFEKLFSRLANFVHTKIEVFTSCIKYSVSIEDAFKKNRVRLLVSLDSSSPETYKKIKQVDAFDKVIENIKTYIKASDRAKENIILKYIVIDEINDNEKEMYAFLDLVSSLGVENVVFSFDYEKYRYDLEIQIPDKYVELYLKFNEYAKNKGLFVEHNTQVDAILKRDYSQII